MLWKHKEELKEQPKEQPVVNPVKEVTPVSTMPHEKRIETGPEVPRGTVAHIGKSVLIKGELSGSEDLYVDGQVEGTIELRDHNLTVGPNGRVQANINAKEVIIHGSLKGNVRAIDRVEIRKSGSLVGDLVAARVMIEDGAYFKGSIDIQKGIEAPKTGEPKKVEVPPPSESHPKYMGTPVEAKKLI